jgi:5-methyltetrahydropteroyltriglutamate--homocysteine methyltransferase
MTIPTEPIGSIPRPISLITASRAFDAGAISEAELRAIYDAAVRDTIHCFEATSSPVITDGEQAKHSFVTYPLDGLKNIARDGIPIVCSWTVTSDIFLD